MARLAILACLCAAVAAQFPIPGNSSEQGLHALAVAAGKLFFGTATETNNLADAAYMQVVNNTREFGLLVPENSQKWESTQPRQGEFTFNNSDAIQGLATANEQIFRCHTLTWFQQLPSFVQTTQWTRETLTAAIEAHISNVVGHFRGRCIAWDVVNEAVNENGTFRESVFFRTLGFDYIPISFRAAGLADPAAMLYYNDFNIEAPGNKSAAVLDMISRLQAMPEDSGVAIHGVGFQAHFTVGLTPTREQLAAHLNTFAALGLEVAYTELDIRHRQLPAAPQAQQQQARDYVSVVGACLDVPACVGVVLWQPTDNYSWIPSTFEGEGDACLWDANMTRKAAYTSVANLLSIAAASAAAVASIDAVAAVGNAAVAYPTDSVLTTTAELLSSPTGTADAAVVVSAPATGSTDPASAQNVDFVAALGSGASGKQAVLWSTTLAVAFFMFGVAVL